MSDPFFSIIIPTFNREKQICETLQSVLNQNFDDFEVLIIDNQSQDETATVVASFSDKRVQFHQNDQNYERCYSRNRGILLAKGKYILLLDSDDLFEFNHLENWHSYILLEGEQENEFYISDKKVFFNENRLINKNPLLKVGQHPVCYFFTNPIIPGQVCFPNKLIKKYRFRDDLLIFEDAAMWMEIAYDYPVKFNTITSFVYCIHENNSINERKNNIYYNRLKAIKLLLKEKKFASILPIKLKRKNINASIMGIIRFKMYNHKKKSCLFWTSYSILFFPEFGFKNKLLILISLLPIVSKHSYFKNRSFF